MKDKHIALDEFLASPDATRWIHQGPLTVYVRRSKRFFEDLHGAVPCFDIANVQVDPDYHNQGFFTRFVESVLTQQADRVYIESVLSPAVEHVATRLGFARMPLHAFSDANFYRDTYAIQPKE